MKKTIAEARRMELEKLTDNYTHDSAISENLMNRFYRICGALNRLLILENTEMTANTVYTQDLDNKTQKAITCLKTDFEKYGLTLVFYGYLPTITGYLSTNRCVQCNIYILLQLNSPPFLVVIQAKNKTTTNGDSRKHLTKTKQDGD